MRKRICSLDITRIVAFCSVLSVHFFLNSNFYHEPINRKVMYIGVILRNAFMICVPLFLLLTGYLTSDRQIDLSKDYKSYIKKLCPLFSTYAIATLMIFIYYYIFFDQTIIFKQLLFNILSYRQYSWYVNMYIGLFLIIPFLNVLWNGLESAKSRRALLIALFSITVLPSIVNIYDFTTIETLLHPYSEVSRQQIVPDWWISFYPITYYFLGAYIKKDVNPRKMSTLKIGILLCASLFIFGIFNIWKSYPNNFIIGAWNEWGSLQNTINTVLVFLFINSINFEKIPKKIQKGISFIADLTFGAYILSFIPDSILYPVHNGQYPNMLDSFLHFPIIVGKSIIISLALSSIIYGLIKLTKIIWKNILHHSQTT